jgi:hypothetical protein
MGELGSVSKFLSEDVEGTYEHSNKALGCEDAASFSLIHYVLHRAHSTVVGHCPFTYVSY